VHLEVIIQQHGILRPRFEENRNSILVHYVVGSVDYTFPPRRGEFSSLWTFTFNLPIVKMRCDKSVRLEGSHTQEFFFPTDLASEADKDIE
jgi:hypothetical protein